MNCHFCGQDIKKGSALCDWCGKRQDGLLQEPAVIKIDEPPSPSDLPTPPESPPSSEIPDEALALLTEDEDRFAEIIERIKANLEWRITWDHLQHDPLLLIAFVFVALGALRALLNLLGLFGDRDIVLDLFVLGVFFGIFQIAWWRWLLFVLIVNVIMQVLLIQAAYWLDAGDLALQLIFESAVNVFLIIVMLLRWRRYR